MSEKMYPIPFKSLMNWVVEEYAASGEIFGVRKAYKATGKSLPIFGERIETPFGPAAGPNSQLAQNIIAAYMAGARFFEVKTVQKMDGADLAACVPRPCILANDEGYNQEWSTELTVPQAMDEYIKAWCALKVLSRVYGFGDPDGFVFNMSVGYDLEGIKGEKVNTYIDGMMDANKTAIFGECKAVLKELFPAESAFIDAISPRVSRSVTVSTLHGCPPDEIERIASYLISEKHLHTFVKCNPTILGYETARRTLDSMGYDYIVFDEHHFNEDLQWADAVPMFERLQALADSKGLEFGLKLSNTFPVDTTRGELPNDEMYMSGRSLFPLTIEMCHRISRQFKGKMRISFAGGAEYFNCDKLFAAGIWPITVATTILKPGGYNRLHQMVEKVEPMAYKPFAGTDTQAICEMSSASHTDVHHVKPIKPLPSRKSEKNVPWIDCFTAPCKGGCPIAQDIPEYMELCNKGLYGPALKLITEKNPLPFITGTICAHRCQTKCSRNFYDESVRIRDTKLLAAQKGYNALMASIKRPAKVAGKRVAIIGGGPTGIAAAYFCGRAGIETTIFERESCLGGVPRHVIPAFRIANEVIEKEGLRRVGFDDAYMTVRDCEKYREKFHAELVPASDLLASLRRVKDAEEIESMIAAQRIAEKALSDIFHEIKPGVTEKEIAARLQYLMLHYGAENMSFDPIVVSGPNGSLPHGVPSEKTIQAGEFVTMDFGCIKNGYCSDMTRTVAVGSASEEMRNVYDTVLRAQLAGIAAAKVGVPGKEIDAAARKVISDAGYGKYFGHGFGHSLGLARTEGQQHQVAGFENRADTLRDAMRRHLVDVVVKESGVIDARLLNQRFDARAGSKRRSRLIEAHMPIRANAQNLHIYATGLFDCLIVGRAGSRNAFAVAQRRPVEHVTRHVHQIRVQSKRFHNRAVNGGMI